MCALIDAVHDLPHLHKILESAEAPPEGLDSRLPVTLAAEEAAEHCDPSYGGPRIGGVRGDDGGLP